MSKWYRTGTATVTNGSATVAGVATYWLTAVNRPMAGDMFTDNQSVYEVDSVGSDGQLTLDRPYEGANASGLSYGIMLSASAATNTRIASQVSEVLELLGSRVTVSTTAPSAGQGKDGDIWIVAAGT